MKRLLTLLLLFFLFTFSLAQDKIFTMEEAVLGSEKSLKIEDIAGLQWMGESNEFCFADTIDGQYSLIKGQIDSDQKTILFPLDSLNKALSDLDIGQLSCFPRIHWIDDNSFYFYTNKKLVLYDIQKKNAVLVNQIKGEAAHIDIESNTYRIAFTREGNLFAALDSGTEIQITHDGGKGICNGDSYVHRAEFGIHDGIFWSPQGEKIAFYRKDESMVTEYPLVDIDTRPATLGSTRYPMAGMVSEQVTIGIYDIKSSSLTFLDTGEPKDQYLPQVTWSPDGSSIYVIHLNRDQNHLQLNEYDPYSGRLLKKILEEKNNKWIEPRQGLVFLKNRQDRFIWFSKGDGFNHLYLYNTDGKLIKQLTHGKQDITAFNGFDDSGENFYYTAASPDGRERHAFRLSLSSGKSKQLTFYSGIHRIDPCARGSFIIDRFSSTTTPRKISLLDKNGQEIRVLLQAENPVKNYKLGEIKFLTIKNKQGIEFNARLILPVDFDHAKKYPVIIYVYGGPHGQMVTDHWISEWRLWFHYMAQRGYIIFTLDNRGTNNRGLDFEQAIFRQLGTIEVEDQMTGIEYLRSLDYVDRDRIGVHGWSYGGFLTVSLMTRRPGVFKAAVAGGPVIDWRYYEVMYGERYMDTPQANPDGYKKACLLNYVDNLEGKLLLIHGTVDPVVVWQHSLLYLGRAIDLGKQVDYFVYPGDGHNMRGRNRLHLYQKITDYFRENL